MREANKMVALTVLVSVVFWAGMIVSEKNSYAQDDPGTDPNATVPAGDPDADPDAPLVLPFPQEDIQVNPDDKIIWGNLTTQRGVDWDFTNDRADLDVDIGSTLAIPAGVAADYDYEEVHGVIWQVVYASDGTVQVDPDTGLREWNTDIGSNPASVAVEEIWRVTRDPSPQFMAWETTRLYLRQGGYVVAAGRADGYKGHIQRWHAARGRAVMPARSIKPAPTDSE